MEVIVTKQFAKDVDEELDKTLQLQPADVIDQVRAVKAVQPIPNITKLSGYKTAGRVRPAVYRIGFIYPNNSVVLSK